MNQEPIFHPQYKFMRWRALTTRIGSLKTDKHRAVWYGKARGHFETRQYPHLYPLTRQATDFEV